MEDESDSKRSCGDRRFPGQQTPQELCISKSEWSFDSPGLAPTRYSPRQRLRRLFRKNIRSKYSVRVVPINARFPEVRHRPHWQADGADLSRVQPAEIRAEHYASHTVQHSVRNVR